MKTDDIQSIAPLQIEEHEGFYVLRDDRVLGGTKRRVLEGYLRGLVADEFVYATVAQGYGAVALAYTCKEMGKRLTIFYPQRHRENYSEQMKLVEALGAQIVSVPCGYMRV